MDKKDLDGKRVMHIDTSCKLYERKDTGIAYNTIGENLHKGCGLSLKLKKELEKNFKVNRDYAQLYAICIYYIIREDLDLFDILVICGDEDNESVKRHIKRLFLDNNKFKDKEIISISELRRITGNPKLKSHADHRARSYRKRVLKSSYRQQRGIELNPVKINFKMISDKWLNKKEVSGE